MALPILTILMRIAAENPQTANDAFPRHLHDLSIRGVKAGSKPQHYPDGGGLTLYVPPTGAKVWRYRYRIGSAPGTLTIGAYPEVGIADARMAHRGARWLVERGIAPLQFIRDEDARLKADEKRAQANTFEAVAKNWMAHTKRALAASTSKHREAMLAKHVMPELGSRALTDITRKDLVALLRTIDAKTPETAKHCRIYINQVFDWAVAEDLIAGNPTPHAKEVQLRRVNARAVTPRKALPVGRIGAFVKTIKDASETEPATKNALQLVLLTWCRTSEVIGAKWCEFNLEAGVWTIPAERMKGGEPHTVHLSDQASRMLREMHARESNSEFVFPNKHKASRHMNRMTLTNWRQRHGFSEIMQVHGLRATASTWANESGRHRSDVIEAALAHRETDRIRAAYNRAQFADELRALWQEWADFCGKCEAIARAENVVALERKMG